MQAGKTRKLITAATLFCALNACSSPSTVAPSSAATSTPPSAPTASTLGSSSASLEATYAALAKEGGKLFTLDPAQSQVRIYVFRAGAAARFGHNHVLSAPQFTGYFYLPGSGTDAARFDLAFRLDALDIDQPEYRAALGPAFASKISPDMIASTREHMLGEANLQAEQYPFVRIHSLQIIGESPRFAARLSVELHGQVREMWVPLTVTGLPDSLMASGSMVLRQSDFGIHPYSALGGILAVADALVIDFTLRGRVARDSVNAPSSSATN
ncbi:polyisoprenoid-binding protein YceI [Herbaspirillum sp. Sphag1AN]|uniref:YceI family protein n=1 Tax=unclassified Herbaspirillum TaxID=2624150 RepID=UPI00161B9067|nr:MULTISPECIES: YceI family protein [unclassified Herbaspirillum]MBB3214059.1 polyisoprenoid-binding protein YceI [Herbaspirillum sp. Sphag1AN]MBB3247548.1 polyisoprenoid-binding protein YceI [Herbaspirillum sp. Sphag64]